MLPAGVAWPVAYPARHAPVSQEAPSSCSLALMANRPGRVAQLARAPRLHRGGRPFESGRAHVSAASQGADLTDANAHPHRRDRLGPRRLLRRRAPAQGRRRGLRGRHVRAAADALGSRALRRGPGPPQDQVGHARVREDRRAPALPLLRQRHLRAARLARGPAAPLPRDRLRDGLAVGPPARHPGRTSARISRGHRVRRLVQRPPRPHRPRGRSALGRARGRDRQRQRRDRRRPDARPDARRSWRRPTPPTTRSTCSRRARSKRSSSSAAAGRRRPRSPTPSCWSSASSRTPT